MRYPLAAEVTDPWTASTKIFTSNLYAISGEKKTNKFFLNEIVIFES